MNTFQAALVIAAKDLKSAFRDRTGLFLGFLLPIVLMSVFGGLMMFIFGGSNGGMPRATLWVVDEDQTERSRGFVDALAGSDMILLRPRENEEPKTREEMHRHIVDGEAHHALIVGKGFAEAIENGTPPDLTMLRDPGREMEDQVTRIALMQAYMMASEGNVWPQALGKMMKDAGLDEEGVQRVLQFSEGIQKTIAMLVADSETSDAAGAEEEEGEDDEGMAGFNFMTMMEDMTPIRNEDIQPPTRPKQLSFQIAQSVAGVIVMMLMFGLMACSNVLLQEREQKTLPRILLCAVPKQSVLWGKLFFTMTMGILQILVLAVYGALVFKVQLFQDPITMIIVSLTWVFTATSFGILIASWAKTAKQAEGLSTILILMMAAMGGCWFPLHYFEDRLHIAAQLVTKCTLTYWAMNAYLDMLWYQLSWTHPQVLLSLGVLWGFSVVAMMLAQSLYNRRYVAG